MKRAMVLKEIWKDAERVFTALSDLFFPRVCAVCGRRLLADERHLCTWCEADLPLTYFWKSPHNSMADRYNGLIQRDLDRKSEAGETGLRVPGYEHAVALFFYMSGTGYTRITQRLKYHGDIACGRYYAGMLAGYLSESREFRDVDMVMPVPLHWARRWSRGFNQAETIARVIAERLGAELVTDVLRRVRRTKTQTKLGVEAKLSNVRGAFMADDRALARHLSLRAENVPPAHAASHTSRRIHIVLVDDVFTTGATLHSCRAALDLSLERLGVEEVDAEISAVTLASVVS